MVLRNIFIINNFLHCFFQIALITIVSLLFLALQLLLNFYLTILYYLTVILILILFSKLILKLQFILFFIFISNIFIIAIKISYCSYIIPIIYKSIFFIHYFITIKYAFRAYTLLFQNLFLSRIIINLFLIYSPYISII